VGKWRLLEPPNAKPTKLKKRRKTKRRKTKQRKKERKKERKREKGGFEKETVAGRSDESGLGC